MAIYWILRRGGYRAGLEAAQASDLVREPAEPPRDRHRGDRPAGWARFHRTTEVVCCWELRPLITTGAEIMDEVSGEASHLMQPDSR